MQREDPEYKDAEVFLNSVFPLFKDKCLFHFPFSGSYLEQPSDLMEVLQLIEDRLNPITETN